MASVAQLGAQHVGAKRPASHSRRTRTLALRAGMGLGAGSMLGLLGGCQVDSFLDPSITGKWEHTPTTMPILDRISVIEDDEVYAI